MRISHGTNLRVVCMATTFNRMFGLLLLWERFFPANENWRTVDEDVLWLSKKTGLLSGVHLVCLLTILERMWLHSKEGSICSLTSKGVHMADRNNCVAGIQIVMH